MPELISAAGDLLQFHNISLLLLGCLLALILGILPGLSSTEAMIILLPFTFRLELNESMILLSAAYASAFVGGALTSIVFGIPGTSTGLATMLDGHPLHKAGKTVYAVSLASWSSMFSGLLSLALVIALLPVIESVSLLFGPAEWFAFVMFGLVVLAFSSQGQFLQCLIAAGLGLLLSVIGLSVITGFPRFTGGFTELWGGIPVVAAFVGLYPMTEAISMILNHNKGDQGEVEKVKEEIRSSSGQQLREGLRDTVKHTPQWSLAGFVGWIVGVIPGVGGVLANLLGYLVVRETLKDKAKFGHGDVRGLVASEASNNGSVGGALVPALALGIPGSLNTAILLSVFTINGVEPGTNIFTENLDTTWLIIMSVAVATVLSSLIVLGGGWRLISIVSKIPPVVIAPTIVFLGCMAVILSRGNTFDLGFAAFMTVVGVTMKAYGYSRISLVIALMLGSLVESSFFQALAIGRGSFWVFIDSPTAIIIWSCVAACFVLHFTNAARSFRARA